LFIADGNPPPSSIKSHAPRRQPQHEEGLAGTDIEAEETSLKSKMAGVFTGKKLMNKKGDLLDAETVLANKEVIAVYFSAHWCPPCKQFTPILKEFFEEAKDDSFIIIFVSSDRDEASMKSYFAEHGDYLACPFGSELVGALKKNCNVTGIPSLAIVDKTGTMLHQGGRSDVGEGPVKALKKWKELSKK